MSRSAIKSLTPSGTVGSGEGLGSVEGSSFGFSELLPSKMLS